MTEETLFPFAEVIDFAPSILFNAAIFVFDAALSTAIEGSVLSDVFAEKRITFLTAVCAAECAHTLSLSVYRSAPLSSFPDCLSCCSLLSCILYRKPPSLPPIPTAFISLLSTPSSPPLLSSASFSPFLPPSFAPSLSPSTPFSLSRIWTVFLIGTIALSTATSSLLTDNKGALFCPILRPPNFSQFFALPRSTSTHVLSSHLLPSGPLTFLVEVEVEVELWPNRIDVKPLLDNGMSTDGVESGPRSAAKVNIEVEVECCTITFKRMRDCTD